jgi:catechol 2,3-dioxygenase-like lactoylglutathione lyase family enzyme
MNVARILNLVPFVPSRDYEMSRRFYADLGFAEKWGGGDACELSRDRFSFILQNFYVKELAENFMMSLLVEDADTWWEYIVAARLQEKYGLGVARPPTIQPWGLRVLYLTDPSGVLWHISDKPKGEQRQG